MWMRFGPSARFAWFIISAFLTECSGVTDLTPGEWSPWKPWSTCTQLCGGGITRRSRTCAAKRLTTPTDVCIGAEEEIKVCNIQACSDGETSARMKLCKHLSVRPYHGRRYHWEPFIDPRRRCQSVCRTLNDRYYVPTRSKIPEGTPCNEDNSRICISGDCKPVGCDGILGSTARLDQCGVCKGNNTDCRMVSGQFTTAELPYGYNSITKIPAGARNINITEVERSRNYLALKTEDGHSILNGNWRLSHFGVRTAAGVLLDYGRGANQSCPGQCVFIPGPISTPIEFLLLYYRHNAGIRYQFVLPPNTTRNSYQVDGLNESSTKSPNSAHRSRGTMSTNVFSLGKKVYLKKKLQRNASSVYRGRHRKYSESFPKHDRVYNTRRNALPTRSERQNQNRNRHRHQSKAEHGQKRGGSENQNVRTGPTDKRDGSLPPPLVLRRKEKPSVANGNNRGPASENSDLESRLIANSVSVGYGQNEDSRLPGRSGSNEYGSDSDTDMYFWRISGFTECSESCGEGVQKTIVVCINGNSQVVVTDDNCNISKKISPQQVKCNIFPCPGSWHTGPWSACSATCGPGLQTRNTQCQRRMSPALNLTVSLSFCSGKPQPQSNRSCSTKPCNYWRVGNWSKCSADCGQGMRKRDVTCASVASRIVADFYCQETKPVREIICDLGSCATGWFYTEWPSECPVECGKGTKKRKIHCSGENNLRLPDEKCKRFHKPRSELKCKTGIPCGGQWYVGPWSKCNVNCGVGVQTRDVICIKKLSDKMVVVVSEENCLADSKPEPSMACNFQPCKPDWYMTSWSQCSRTCGLGYKTRELKCLDDQQRPSLGCDGKLKPTMRHSCNEQRCGATTESPDSDCLDLFRQCHMVLRARLCRYHYYRQICCNSCSSYT